MAADQMSEHVLELDHAGVRKILPHGPKALFIESAVVSGLYVTAVMDLEPLQDVIRDHFGVAKGTDVQEALEQAGGIVAQLRAEPGHDTFVTGADKVKWRGQVKADDKVIIQAWIEARKGAATRGRGSGVATVDGVVVCSGEFSYVLRKSEGEQPVEEPAPAMAPPASVSISHHTTGVPALTPPCGQLTSGQGV